MRLHVPLQAIVWCNQLVTLLAGTLLDIPSTAAAAAAPPAARDFTTDPDGVPASEGDARTCQTRASTTAAYTMPTAGGGADTCDAATAAGAVHNEIIIHSCPCNSPLLQPAAVSAEN